MLVSSPTPVIVLLDPSVYGLLSMDVLIDVSNRNSGLSPKKCFGFFVCVFLPFPQFFSGPSSVLL